MRSHIKVDFMHTGLMAIRIFNRVELFLIHKLFLNSKAIDRFSINAWETLSANNYFQALHSRYVICYLCNDIIELFDVAKKNEKKVKQKSDLYKKCLFRVRSTFISFPILGTLSLSLQKWKLFWKVKAYCIHQEVVLNYALLFCI